MVMNGQTDWAEASATVGKHYFPHKLFPLEPGSTANDVRLRSCDLGPVRIASITWGSPVLVETAHEGALAVNLPITGSLTSRIGRRVHVATPERATVYPADAPVRLVKWDADCRILGVRVDLAHLQREAARLFGVVPTMPTELSLHGHEESDWVSLVQTIARSRTDHPLVREQLAGAVTTAILLAAIPDDAGASGSAEPRTIRKLVERLRAEPELAWTAADMAEVASASIRRLQEGFREHLGTTPRDFLKSIRLERAKLQLENPAPCTTVTDIALANGFVHLGRFASDYRTRYGESPSETLRRALAR